MQKPSIYTRPAAKPRRLAIPRAKDAPVLAALEIPQPLYVDKGTECHVTPSAVATSMVYYAEVQAEHRLLEPEAGTGNIVAAMVGHGHAISAIVAIERHGGLCQALHQRFKDLPLVNACFLEWAMCSHLTFDRVIMNPPFRHARKHVDAAATLLAPGGVLIALVPVTFKHPEAVDLEFLSNDTFSTAKVNTKIIRIERG